MQCLSLESHDLGLSGRAPVRVPGGLWRDRVRLMPNHAQGYFYECPKQQCRHEQAASKETAALIPAEAKAKQYRMRGLHAPSGDVCDWTVDKFLQSVGGAYLPVCEKVQESALAHVRASRSFMQLMS